jgi:hypothetical protein
MRCSESAGGGLTRRCGFLISTFSIAAILTMAGAQQAAPAGNNDAVANPGRPTVTTPATLTPVGFLQFEKGIIGAWHSPEFSIRFGFNEAI